MKRRLYLLAVFFVFILTGAGGLSFWVCYDLPSIEKADMQVRIPGVRITDRNGRILYEVVRDDDGSHLSVPLEVIPSALRQATIDTEDARFYSNPGIDMVGLFRAVWINISGGETISGGSTITQQVARNLLLSLNERGERTLRRKLREMVLAWQLTQKYSKDDILALYLNQTYYGGMTYGVEAASRVYFGKTLAKLSLAECALLAGLPQAPSLYNPYSDPNAALLRRNVVLDLMLKTGNITADQARQAKNEPIVLSGNPFPLEAPHFVWLIRSQIDSLYTPEEILAGGGLVVRTSLDLSWQQAAEKAVSNQLSTLQKEGSHDVYNAAVVVLNPQNGQVLVMVGNPDFFDQKHHGAVNMAVSPRQPGSALKPFIYALAMDPAQPKPWTAAEMLLDVRTHFLTKDGKTYTPENFDRQEHGPVSVRQALASSLNIPAVTALEYIGLESASQFFSRLGMDSLSSPLDFDISLALGGGEVSLLDLTGAYGVLANQGSRLPRITILEIRDGQGKLLYQNIKPVPEQVMDPRTAWLISDILSDDDARSLGFPAHSILNIGRPAAVKTGTTTNYHDNWTIGYTPDLVVGVWAGNAGQEPMRDVTGLSGAGPIWHTVIRDLTAGQPELSFKRPDGMQQLEVCALSGKLPSQACSYTRSEWFMDGTIPTQIDSIFRKVVVDMETGKLANEKTPKEQCREVTVLDLPAAAAPWGRQHGLILWGDLFRIENEQIQPSTKTGIWIVTPGTGSNYVMTKNNPAENQQVKIEASTSNCFEGVTIYLDGSILANLQKPPYQTWWKMQAGAHRLWAECLSVEHQKITSPVVEISVQGF